VRGAFAFGGFQEGPAGFRVRVVELRDGFVETVAIFRAEVLKAIMIGREPFEEIERGGYARLIAAYARPSSSRSIRVL
jgi:hypothetical protein